MNGSLGFDLPHRRKNLLTGEWVLVSAHRTERPWQGQVEKDARSERPSYDPTCYLCPGNRRAHGERNPAYDSTYVFDNDFPALMAKTGELDGGSGLFQARSETGRCRVICFSPRHDLTLAEMDPGTIRHVVDAWCNEFAELGAQPDINHVQIFENKGEMMGCSNPHPHGQIWAQSSIPAIPASETRHMAEHLSLHGTTLLQDYLAAELESGERIVFSNAHFVAVVPYWAVWPFETLVVCRRRAATLLELTDDERSAFADIVSGLTLRYDNLFETSFPYSAGIHQAPTDGADHPEWDLHMHFCPPLLRSATVRKFMVGYELMAEAQRDLTPETAAERLRALPTVHWKAR